MLLHVVVLRLIGHVEFGIDTSASMVLVRITHVRLLPGASRRFFAFTSHCAVGGPGTITRAYAPHPSAGARIKLGNALIVSTVPIADEVETGGPRTCARSLVLQP